MTQNAVNKFAHFTAVMELEEPACAMANSAWLALEYISPILLDLRKAGALSANKCDAAGHALAQMATEAGRFRDATYTILENARLSQESGE